MDARGKEHAVQRTPNRLNPGMLVPGLAFFSLLLSNGLAVATPDFEEGSIGIYFTSDTFTNCIPAAVGEEVTCHVILSNPSTWFDPEFLGWEMTVAIDGPHSVTEWNLNGDHVNLLPPPAFAVAFAEPIPFAYHNLLLTFTVLVAGPEPIVFRTLAIFAPSCPPNEPHYHVLIGGWEPNCMPMNPITGYDANGEYNPVAVINDDCWVPVDATSWGAVKALYR